MNYKPLLLLGLIFLCHSCKQNPIHSPIENPLSFLQKNDSIDLKNWHFLDIEIDSVPGISLNRAYDSLLIDKESKEIVIAIIDSELDINHNDLKNHIWTNKNEITNNQIDDDGNGYIDDYNGWNFLGNDKGDNITYASLEIVRIIQHFENQFKNKKIENIPQKELNDFKLYVKVKSEYDEKLKQKISDKKYGDFLFHGYPAAKNALKPFFPNENYEIEKLDSLYSVFKEKDTVLAKHAYFISDFLKYNLTEEWIIDYKNQVDSSLAKTYNLNFYDRSKIDPKPNDIKFTEYGNPFLNKNLHLYSHSTKVAGVIVDQRQKNKKLHHIKIMPLAISPYGNENDKDIALAIRYAVDNGAQVINMSFGKQYSLNKEWVFDAIIYAAERDVLIISSAGNSSYDLTINNDYYPNDNIDNGLEVSDNFLLVGSTSHSLNQNLMSYYSNFGSLDVDLFAPGQEIYTTLPKNQYDFDSGTSLSAALTSKTAALIRSYYPDLTASQVKHILMDSGIEYTIEVATPTEDDPDKTTPFNQLSKSGKVLNAYNALIMAERVSRGM